MNIAINLPIYHRREVVAQLGTVLVGFLFWVASQTLAMRQDVPVREEPINLSLLPPPSEPEKIIEQPVRTIQPPHPEKLVERPKEIIPVPEAPALVHVQQPVAVPPVSPVEKAEPTKAIPQAPQSNSDAEGLFAQDVRARIERKKIYPDTARDLGMSGEVEVSYELDRAGHLVHAEITTSSGYKLLDQAALKAVKSATYKNFPDDAWVGASSKMFRTKLVFSINQ